MCIRDRYFHDKIEDKNRLSTVRSLNSYGGRQAAPTVQEVAEGGVGAPIKGLGKARRRPRTRTRSRKPKGGDNSSGGKGKDGKDSKGNGKGKGKKGDDSKWWRSAPARDGSIYAPLTTPDDLKNCPPGTITNQSGAPIICYWHNYGGCKTEGCKFWHKLLNDDLKSRLRKPGDRSASRIKGRGKNGGKWKPRSQSAAPAQAELAAPAQNDVNAETRYKGLIDKCKQRTIMICTAYLGSPQQCKKNNDCGFLHYNQSLADKAVNAHDKGEPLPMDLHTPPRNSFEKKR